MNHGREALSWSVEFALTEVQVDAEPSLGTALTLATRASNLIAQAEDLLVFQGVVMPADRLRPLVERGLYGTAALAELSGLVLSLGGEAIDLVVGVEPAVAFLQVDSDALFRFRVFERFALRLKDDRSLVRLVFVH
jgi:hypothetical protein